MHIDFRHCMQLRTRRVRFNTISTIWTLAAQAYFVLILWFFTPNVSITTTEINDILLKPNVLIWAGLFFSRRVFLRKEKVPFEKRSMRKTARRLSTATSHTAQNHSDSALQYLHAQARRLRVSMLSCPLPTMTGRLDAQCDFAMKEIHLILK